jgi:hypothetical protein
MAELPAVDAERLVADFVPFRTLELLVQLFATRNISSSMRSLLLGVKGIKKFSGVKATPPTPRSRSFSTTIPPMSRAGPRAGLRRSQSGALPSRSRRRMGHGSISSRASSPNWRVRCCATSRVSSKDELKQRLIALIGDINREPVVHTGRYKIDNAARPHRYVILETSY